MTVTRTSLGSLRNFSWKLPKIGVGCSTKLATSDRRSDCIASETRPWRDHARFWAWAQMEDFRSEKSTTIPLDAIASKYAPADSISTLGMTHPDL